ncbi:MAG: malic enzyme-like NAD(P)-binding protein, partial [Flammeovirgaceae bacterium]
YFSSADKGLMYSMTFNWHTDDVELIVVTDGSRVLGLGDLGTNGMGISLGKLQLYTACAGIHPSKCLPVVIDVGTNNESLINDSMYLGLQQKRLTGEKYDEIIEEFINAARERFTNALIQFEDFSTENASRILEKYRNKILCFNDDMQGTATVTLAGLLGALRASGHRLPDAALLDQRIIVVGAGTAGLGVSSGILYSMMQTGLTEEE